MSSMVKKGADNVSTVVAQTTGVSGMTLMTTNSLGSVQLGYQWTWGTHIGCGDESQGGGTWRSGGFPLAGGNRGEEILDKIFSHTFPHILEWPRGDETKFIVRPGSWRQGKNWLSSHHSSGTHIRFYSILTSLHEAVLWAPLGKEESEKKPRPAEPGRVSLEHARGWSRRPRGLRHNGVRARPSLDELWCWAHLTPLSSASTSKRQLVGYFTTTRVTVLSFQDAEVAFWNQVWLWALVRVLDLGPGPLDSRWGFLPSLEFLLPLWPFKDTSCSGRGATVWLF